MYKRFIKYATKHKKELAVLIVLLSISALAHGYNMYHYPYYENDEGTYLSRAWSLLQTNDISPYTFWYDHVPAGWMFIAVWVKLVGGFYTFGNSVDTGRMFMLVIHLANVALLFFISKKITKSTYPAIIATVIFSLSPLAIFFQRRVLLDNMMTFWLLLTSAILLKENVRLRDISAAAVTFAVAVLTKEPGIVFFPVFACLVFFRSHKEARTFAVVNWITIVGIIGSLYAVYALLKGELIPDFGQPIEESISLLGTLLFHANRGSDVPFWNQQSSFWGAYTAWLNKDVFFTYLTMSITGIGVLMSLFKANVRFLTAMCLMYWAFLLFGGLVIEFYIIPLIPFVALLTGVVVFELLSLGIKHSQNTKRTLLFLTAVTLVLVFGLMGTKQYFIDETTPQVRSVAWTRTNIPTDSILVIDTAMFVDLRDPHNPSGIYFPYAHPGWLVEKDPEIFDDLLKDDWKNIDYIALSHEIVKQVGLYEFPRIDRALDSALFIQEWRNSDSATYVNVEKRISTNGDWAAIYKIPDIEDLILTDSWEYYKKNFIVSYGQVIDPDFNDVTTSEGQSYAMLRAVWANDRNTFDGVWQWTRDHFQYRTDKLISWLWQKDEDGEYRLGDSASASDADLDIALALVLAYNRWENEIYLTQAKEIINDIWEKEVVSLRNNYYLLAGSNAETEDTYIINPSYLSPGHFYVFSQVDPIHPWLSLRTDSYELLASLQRYNNNQTGLPTNWIGLTKDTGRFRSLSYIYPENADYYGFDAFRTFWRVALDAQWSGNPQAFEYLDSVEPFLRDEVEQNGRLRSIYSLNGDPVVEYSALSTDTPLLVAASVLQRTDAHDIYLRDLEGVYNYDEGYWGKDGVRYYDQNWAWFAAGLYFDRLYVYADYQ